MAFIVADVDVRRCNLFLGLHLCGTGVPLDFMKVYEGRNYSREVRSTVRSSYLVSGTTTYSTTTVSTDRYMQGNVRIFRYFSIFGVL